MSGIILKIQNDSHQIFVQEKWQFDDLFGNVEGGPRWMRNPRYKWHMSADSAPILMRSKKVKGSHCRSKWGITTITVSIKFKTQKIRTHNTQTNVKY